MHPTRYVIDRAHGLRNFETLHDNVFWGGAEPRISICVPTLRHDVTPLLEGLAQCEARRQDLRPAPVRFVQGGITDPALFYSVGQRACWRRGGYTARASPLAHFLCQKLGFARPRRAA